MQQRVFALLGLLVLSSSPGKVLGQAPLGNQAGQSSSAGRAFDPDQIFDRYSGGKSIWVRSEITDPRWLRLFDRVAQQLGIAGGQITRGQFRSSMEQRASRGQKSTGNQGISAPSGPESFDDMAQRQFKLRDRNGDGYLNSDEMPGGLRAQVSRWDTNGDGLIDLNEYKAYLQARMAQRQGPGRPFTFFFVPQPEEEPKHVVYSPKNFPKELPAWFKQLDVDGDGQVGVYEWHRAGKSLEEFQALDRNGDGFLTVEEVLYDQALVKKEGTKADPQLVAGLNPGKGPGQPAYASAGPASRGGTGSQAAAGRQQGADSSASPSAGPPPRSQRFRDRPTRDNGNAGDFGRRNSRGGGKQGP
jgi:Ca2+-binding EF-hand superfamily protein